MVAAIAVIRVPIVALLARERVDKPVATRRQNAAALGRDADAHVSARQDAVLTVGASTTTGNEADTRTTVFLANIPAVDHPGRALTVAMVTGLAASTVGIGTAAARPARGPGYPKASGCESTSPYEQPNRNAAQAAYADRAALPEF
jgi:hypothetical protein